MRIFYLKSTFRAYYLNLQNVAFLSISPIVYLKCAVTSEQGGTSRGLVVPITERPPARATPRSLHSEAYTLKEQHVLIIIRRA
jgi:hypothetical protein